MKGGDAMLLLEASIIMIALVVISNIISHYIVFLPTALIEIAIGLAVVLLFDVNITLEADWFMLLFVAPLLFNDAKHYPKKKMWELRAPIFGYAIILVFFTTVLGGYFIHWLIPEFPLSLAMALIAVLSPTDPVAVQSIAEQVKLPDKIMNLISGESLINDASGLIAFKYALAAFMTSYFSIFEAASNFLYMALVGALIGFILMMLIYFFKFNLLKQGIQDVILHSTIQLLTPFIIYMVAEEFHASGVIAVVAAGFTSMNQKNPMTNFYPEAKLVTNRMWDILIYALNGTVFVLLGAELPIALTDVIKSPNIHNAQLFMYIIVTWLFLLIIRIVWSYIYVWFSSFKKNNDTKPSLFTAILTGLTGVRGAVTMATIMSMPLVLDNGDIFPQRSLMIAIACGVVITSLIVASAVLPILTKNHTKIRSSSDDCSQLDEEDELIQTNAKIDKGYISEIKARQIMNERVITHLKEFNIGEDELITADLIHEFQMRLKHLHFKSMDDEASNLYTEIEKSIQIVALEGERQAVAKAKQENKFPDKLTDVYLKNIEAKKNSLDSDWKYSFFMFWATLKAKVIQLVLSTKHQEKPEEAEKESSMFYQLELLGTRGAIQLLRDYSKHIDPTSKTAQAKKEILNQKLHEYIYKLQRIKFSKEKHASNYQEKLAEYYNYAIYTERKTIHDLYSSGKISIHTANKLRQSISYYETTLL